MLPSTDGILQCTYSLELETCYHAITVRKGKDAEVNSVYLRSIAPHKGAWWIPTYIPAEGN